MRSKPFPFSNFGFPTRTFSRIIFTSSFPITDHQSLFHRSGFRACRASGLCQGHNMKQFLLGCLLCALIIPTLSIAQTAQLTEQLGKTVLYEDIALSPDGSHVAWVQSTAATTSKQACIQTTSPNPSAATVNLGSLGQRIDADPAWSPDSKTVALFSTAGEKDQRQLWTVNADGSNPRKLSKLKGYAARPRWSHDGKQLLSIINGSPFSTFLPRSYARCPQRIFTSTTTIGLPMTRNLSQLPLQVQVTTTGGSRRSTRSTSQRGRPHQSTSLRSK
ncbi:MAG: hypothetical protein DME44_01300 [Verrucomicrobia bacterium]|nr:MAG: hypothetical protein DME44_01300 [Verrucomicrobiota bacterium]